MFCNPLPATDNDNDNNSPNIANRKTACNEQRLGKNWGSTAVDCALVLMDALLKAFAEL